MVLSRWLPLPVLATALSMQTQAADPAAAFQIGADISSLPQVEAAGGIFKDANKPGDLMAVLKAHGITHGRLRIWNDPKSGHCGLEQTLAMAKRLRDAGMPILLDFHYSDTWADPGHQPKPAAWAALHGEQLETAIFEYTRKVIVALDQQGTPPAIVQIGNEITPGMLWDDGKLGGTGDEAQKRWRGFARLVAAGIRGVRDGRDGKPPIRVMIHVDCGGNNAVCRWFFDHLKAEGVEFDIIGLSYYPWWHGPLEKLKANLDDLSGRYMKDLIVVETAYPWSPIGIDPQRKLGERFPASVDGQLAFLAEVVKTVRSTEGGRGKGVYYWEPGWLATPKAGSPWAYRTLFGREGALLESIRGLSGQTAGEK